MIKTLFSVPKVLFTFTLVMLSATLCAQVGIGNTNPDPSSALDITSETSGLLTPRMTSVQRLAIVNPANGLTVFDTDEQIYFFYDLTDTNWVPLLSEDDKRDNYVLVKSVDDFPAPSAGTITLDENTYYEINGTITLTNPINLNNAYIAGEDTNEDILLSSGTVFQGATGGSVRNITITGGGTVFNISGPGSESAETLIVQNTIIAGMANVGTIADIGLYFANIVQFVSNASGITYSNIGKLLLNNEAWTDSNAGTFETLTGAFGLVEKISGFSTVPAGAVGFDVSSNPSISMNASLQNTFFSGAGTYVNGYNPEPYIGYNFSKDWSVNAPGILRESDNVATGDINFDVAVGSGAFTDFTGTGAASRIKVEGPTVSNNLFRFSRDGNNRIVYDGRTTRFFQFTGSISFQARNIGVLDNPTIYVLYVAKGNGTGPATVLTETKVFGRAVDNNAIIALPMVGTLEMAENDYIEVWAERFSGGGDMLTVSLNATLR